MNLINAAVKYILISFIKIYQILLSPFFGRQCRFIPTCSNYSHEALEKHGVFKGIYLTIRRLLQCHPWGNSGYDSVPD